VPLFAVRYAYTDDLDTRSAVRPEHRQFLAAQPTLKGSGPTDDDGALLVFEAESASAVEAILDDDPFATAGVIASRTVVGWNVVIGPWSQPG
jgi:uncharacterized protein YciI